MGAFQYQADDEGMTIRTFIISTFVHWALSLMTQGMPGRKELALASMVFHQGMGDER
jgi:hypothetical protein